jgi:hypothetical protein
MRFASFLARWAGGLKRFLRKRWSDVAFILVMAVIICIPNRNSTGTTSQPFHPTFEFFAALVAGAVIAVLLAICICVVLDGVKGEVKAFRDRRAKPRGFEVIMIEPALPEPPSAVQGAEQAKID